MEIVLLSEQAHDVLICVNRRVLRESLSVEHKT